MLQNEYYQQRLENIKRNAKYMEARGFDNKILQHNAETYLKHAREEDIMSSDDDATYKPTYENEGEISCKGSTPSTLMVTKSKATRKQPLSTRGRMSDFTQPSPVEKEHPQPSSNQQHQKPLLLCPKIVSRSSEQQQQQSAMQPHHRPLYLCPDTVSRNSDRQQQFVTHPQHGPFFLCSKTVSRSFEQQQQTGVSFSPDQQQHVRRSSKHQTPLIVHQPPTLQDVHQPSTVKSSMQQRRPHTTVQESLGKQQKSTKKGQPNLIPQGALSAYRELRKQQRCGDKKLDNMRVENVSPNFVTNESELVENANEDEQALAGRKSMEESQPASVEAPKKKHGGPTKLTEVHARTLDERPTIVLNSYGQPIGPSEEICKEFTRFLGTLAKNAEFAPLHYCDWPSLPTHEKIWNYVLEKYIVPFEGKKWVMETTNESWRAYKSYMKRKHFLAYDSGQLRWENHPKTLSSDSFKQLLAYWNNDKIKAESKKNRNNRLLLDDMHTMGPSSYASLRHKLKEKDPNKEEPSKAKVYRASRERNPKRSYKTNFGVAKKNMEQMEAMEAQEQGKDPYHEVMKKPEHGGRLRLYGKGVTKSILKKVGKNSTYNFAPEFIQSMQQQVLEQLLEANPEVKRLLEANPGVKFVVPDVCSATTGNKSIGSESYGQSSVGMHSNNEQVNVEENDDVDDHAVNGDLDVDHGVDGGMP